jgi:hypothetical protein
MKDVLKIKLKDIVEPYKSNLILTGIKENTKILVTPGSMWKPKGIID